MRQLSCGAIGNTPRVRAAILRESTEALDSSLMSQIGEGFSHSECIGAAETKNYISQKHCRFDFSDFGRLRVGNHGKEFYKKFS